MSLPASPKFKVGDSVTIKKDPLDSWLVIKVRIGLLGMMGGRKTAWAYEIVNPHSHKRTVFENEIWGSNA
jgi:hypothetical protein